jgi:hypothetical protein
MYYIDTPDAIALLPQSRFGDGVWVVDIKLLSIMEAVFRYGLSSAHPFSLCCRGQAVSVDVQAA